MNSSQNEPPASFPDEDCYDTLGIDSDASQDSIRETWAKLCNVYRDGLGVGARGSAAEAKLRTINAAYAVLKKVDSRKKYDEWRRRNRQPPSPRVSPGSLDFGTLKPNESRTKRITVENDGGPVTRDINFSMATEASQFRLSFDEATDFPKTVDVTFDAGNAYEDRDFHDTLTIALDGTSAEVRLKSHVRSASTFHPSSFSKTASASGPAAATSGTPVTPAPPPAPVPTPFPIGAGIAICVFVLLGFVYLMISRSRSVSSFSQAPPVSQPTMTITRADSCIGQFASASGQCEPDETRLHLGVRFDYVGASLNQTVRIVWTREGAVLGQSFVSVRYPVGYLWNNYTSTAELTPGDYHATLYSGDRQGGGVQMTVEPSATQLQAKHQAAAEELARAEELFANREYKAAITACDRAIGVGSDNRQDAVQLRNRIVQTMNILGDVPTPDASDTNALVKPSFDCNYARTATERIICSDQNLASLDVQMVQAYKDALSRMTDSDQTRFRADHSQWFAEYQRRCNALAQDSSELRQCVERSLTEHRDYLRNR